jgi:hypothetical protein
MSDCLIAVRCFACSEPESVDSHHLYILLLLSMQETMMDTH